MPNTKPLPSLDAIEPRLVWRIFQEISSVPRPSGKEEKIRAHVLAWAKAQGLPAREDAAGNILISAPASPGCERAPVTVLQGHMDMVCEKNTGTVHDFDRDPIRLAVDRDAQRDEIVVRAEGTTLGADNGIGLAMGMAAAVSPGMKHGPLEILCTVDEEVGLNGAQHLAKGFFTGKRLLNLDSEEDDTLTIGCAGGCDTTLSWEFGLSPLPADVELVEVTVRGLHGGHSGTDIHLNRGNANRMLVRILRSHSEAAAPAAGVRGGSPATAGPAVGALRLVRLDGGSKRNAIAREAVALVAVPRGGQKSLVEAAARVRAEAVQENNETACTCEVSAFAGARPDGAAALSAADTELLLTCLGAAPHGVIAIEPEIPGFVRTSTNLATVDTRLSSEQAQVVVAFLSRSSSIDSLHDVVGRITALGSLARAQVHSANEYIGWQPDMNAALLAACRKVYKELFGEECKVAGIHAGLECGILSDKVDGLEMVSLGARILGAHSPDERVFVPSVQKVWRYLGAVLEELAKG